MRALDTNILARFILQDEADQARLASEIIRTPVWISLSVWLELGWVLGRKLGLDRLIVSEALDALLAIDTVNVADRSGLHWAIARYRAGADWADMVHLVAARGAADLFLTFDGAICRRAGEEAPLPIETLA